MKLTPYSIVFSAVVVLLGSGITASAEELTITGLKFESATSTGDEGTSTEVEWRIDYTPNAEVDPTAGDFELICGQLHLTIPPWAFEPNAMGGWSVIDPNDPQAMGIALVVTDETGEYELSLRSADADVSSEDADATGDIFQKPVTPPIDFPQADFHSSPCSFRIGDSSGVISFSEPGTSIREFEYLPAVEPQSGFIELNDAWRIVRNEDGATVETQTSAQIATGGEVIDPTQGVEVTWGDGKLQLIFPPYTIEKKILSVDQKLFRWQVVDGFPGVLGITLISVDDLGNAIESFPDVVDFTLTPNFPHFVTWNLGLSDEESPEEEFGETGPVGSVKLGAFEAIFDEHDAGTLVREFEFRPERQEPAVEVCDNGIDDDGDGLIDFRDPDCNVDPL